MQLDDGEKKLAKPRNIALQDSLGDMSEISVTCRSLAGNSLGNFQEQLLYVVSGLGGG